MNVSVVGCELDGGRKAGAMGVGQEGGGGGWVEEKLTGKVF